MEEAVLLLASASFLLLFDVQNRPQSSLSIKERCEGSSWRRWFWRNHQTVKQGPQGLTDASLKRFNDVPPSWAALRLLLQNLEVRGRLSKRRAEISTALFTPTAFLSVGDCQKDVPAAPLCPHTRQPPHLTCNPPVLWMQWETVCAALREAFSSGNCASSQKLPCRLCLFWSCWISGNPRDEFCVWSSNSQIFISS